MASQPSYKRSFTSFCPPDTNSVAQDTFDFTPEASESGSQGLAFDNIIRVNDENKSRSWIHEFPDVIHRARFEAAQTLDMKKAKLLAEHSAVFFDGPPGFRVRSIVVDDQDFVIRPFQP